jgi:hypothetical protein
MPSNTTKIRDKSDGFDSGERGLDEISQSVQNLVSDFLVPRGGIEPPTPAFSVQCSTN